MSAFGRRLRRDSNAVTVVKIGASGHSAWNSAIARSAPPAVVSQSAIKANFILSRVQQFEHIVGILGFLGFLGFPTIFPVLKRPTRPLPRKFNRPLTPGTRTFVERRHRRIREHRRERSRRWFRRARAIILDRIVAARRYIKFLIIGVAILVASLLLFSPLLRVREIRVVRTEGRVDLAAVLEALAPLYDRHMLLVSVHDVTFRVRAVVPDARTVSVTKSYPAKLSVRIALAPLVARVRIQTSPSAGSGARVATRTGSGSTASVAQQEFLTDDGLLVTAPHGPASEALPTIRVVDWSARPAPGRPLLSPEFFDRLRRAEQALTLEFGQQIVLRTVYLRAREFHLDGPVVSYWFDTRSTLESQLQRLRVFLRAVKLSDVKSYVDLRLTGRVVYK